MISGKSVRTVLLVCMLLLATASSTVLADDDTQESAVEVQWEEGSDSLDLALVQPSPLDRLARSLGLLPYTDDQVLYLENTGKLSTKLSLGKVRVQGELKHVRLAEQHFEFSNLSNQATPGDSFETVAALNVSGLPADEYKGRITFELEGTEEELRLPVSITVKDAVVWPFVAVAVGVVIQWLSPVFLILADWPAVSAERDRIKKLIGALPRESHGAEWLKDHVERIWEAFTIGNEPNAPRKLGLCHTSLFGVVQEEVDLDLWERIDDIPDATKKTDCQKKLKQVYADIDSKLDSWEPGAIAEQVKNTVKALQDLSTEVQSAARDKVPDRVPQRGRQLHLWLRKAFNRIGLSDWGRLGALLLQGAVYAVVLGYVAFLGLQKLYASAPTWGVNGPQDFLTAVGFGFASDLAGKTVAEVVKTVFPK